MTVKTAEVDVTDEPTILTDGGRAHSIDVTNTGESTVKLGGPDVTMDDGLELAAGASISVDLGAGEDLYAIADTTGTVTTFRAGA